MAVGRFQVMATLQAARAYVLGKPIETAKSFGLNRAIFYAAAKKGFKFIKGAALPEEVLIEKRRVPKERIEEIRKSFRVDEIGDELAYAVSLSDTIYYTIGGEV